MSNHTVSIAGSDGAWQGKCTCGQRSPVVVQRWEVDDWVLGHEASINLARAHLRTQHPSLVDQRNWYRLQADRPDISQRERDQWTTLADGLDHRIGHPVDENPLFD